MPHYFKIFRHGGVWGKIFAKKMETFCNTQFFKSSMATKCLDWLLSMDDSVVEDQYETFRVFKELFAHIFFRISGQKRGKSKIYCKL